MTKAYINHSTYTGAPAIAYVSGLRKSYGIKLSVVANPIATTVNAHIKGKHNT
jgi:hypothetical protein